MFDLLPDTPSRTQRKPETFPRQCGGECKLMLDRDKFRVANKKTGRTFRACCKCLAKQSSDWRRRNRAASAPPIAAEVPIDHELHNKYIKTWIPTYIPSQEELYES